MWSRTAITISAFASTVPMANWMISHVGTCTLDGPCVIPVGFGFSAPSGVLLIGAAMVLRDLVHEAGGIQAALIAIFIGSVASWVIAPPALVIASVAAFTLAELSDLAVYAPLRERRLGLAVLASGVAGSIIDSAIFLWLAFGSLAFVEGQILGKAWMSLAGFIALNARKSRP